MPGSVFVDGLGSSEMGHSHFFIAHTPDTDRYNRCIGKVHSFADAKVFGPDGDELPSGQVGELGTKSPTLSLGYWNDSARTYRTRFRGYFMTGDLVYRDDDGYYYHLDRKADSVDLGDGSFIYTAACEERILARCPGRARLHDRRRRRQRHCPVRRAAAARGRRRPGARPDRAGAGGARGARRRDLTPGDRRRLTTRSRSRPPARSASSCCASAIWKARRGERRHRRDHRHRPDHSGRRRRRRLLRRALQRPVRPAPPAGRAPGPALDSTSLACPPASTRPACCRRPRRGAVDRFVLLGLLAADRALADAGLEVGTDVDPYRIARGRGHRRRRLGDLRAVLARPGLQRGRAAVSPYLLPGMLSNMATARIAIKHGIRGYQLGDRDRLRGRGTGDRRGLPADRATAAPTWWSAAAPSRRCIPTIVAAFGNARALASGWDDPAGASRPFDRRRNGFVLGEGAAIMVVERGQHARARGAARYASLIGWGATTDAHHPTMPRPDGEGAAACMRQAIARAGLVARRHRLPQRPRHQHQARRRRRGQGDPRGLRRRQSRRSARSRR